jgi:toxin YoeB
MKNVLFTPKAFAQYNQWRETPEIQDKIIRLINDIARDPFRGIGKPEPLKHNYKGFWSRRITEEHRLVYEVRDDFISILSCKFHYDS